MDQDTENTLKELESYCVSDEEDAEYKKREAKMKRKRVLWKSRIPEEYKRARLYDCDQQFAESGTRIETGLSRGVIIRGDVGRGKTYAACAMLHHASAVGSVMYVGCDEFLANIKGMVKAGTTEDEIVSNLVAPRLLLLDDLGKGKLTEAGLSALFHLLNDRLNKCKATILTTQLELDSLGKWMERACDIDVSAPIAEAILSRIEQLDLIELEGNDRRTQGEGYLISA